jgi:hypothetical protein
MNDASVAQCFLFSPWSRRLQMKIRAALMFVVALTAFAVVAYAADEKKEKSKEGTVDAKFDQFKQLAGDWVGKAHGSDGKDIHDATVSYKVTSAGSTVVETIGPGTPHEMVTVINKDGDDLSLTHYCAMGNQPHMKAPGKGENEKVAFAFTSGGNMKSDKEAHMHAVTFTFIDKDTLKTEWSSYADGKESATMVFELKRKK